MEVNIAFTATLITVSAKKMDVNIGLLVMFGGIISSLKKPPSLHTILVTTFVIVIKTGTLSFGFILEKRLLE